MENEREVKMTIFALIGNGIQLCIAVLMLTELAYPWSDRAIFIVVVMLVVPVLNLVCFLPDAVKNKIERIFRRKKENSPTHRTA